MKLRKILSKQATYLLVVISLFLFTGCTVKVINTDEERAYVEATPESLQRGQVLYETYCLQCHGVEGKGDGEIGKKAKLKVADLTEKKRHITRFGLLVVIEKPHFSKFTIKKQIQHPSGTMPEVKDELSKEEMDDLINYVKKLIYS